MTFVLIIKPPALARASHIYAIKLYTIIGCIQGEYQYLNQVMWNRCISTFNYKATNIRFNSALTCQAQFQEAHLGHEKVAGAFGPAVRR